MAVHAYVCVFVHSVCVRLSLRTKTVTTARTNTTTTTRSNKKIFHLNNLQFTSLVAVVTVWWYVWHTTIFYEWIYIHMTMFCGICMWHIQHLSQHNLIPTASSNTHIHGALKTCRTRSKDIAGSGSIMFWNLCRYFVNDTLNKQ